MGDTKAGFSFLHCSKDTFSSLDTDTGTESKMPAEAGAARGF